MIAALMLHCENLLASTDKEIILYAVWRIEQRMISTSNLLDTLFQERCYFAEMVLEN